MCVRVALVDSTSCEFTVACDVATFMLVGDVAVLINKVVLVEDMLGVKRVIFVVALAVDDSVFVLIFNAT